MMTNSHVNTLKNEVEQLDKEKGYGDGKLTMKNVIQNNVDVFITLAKRGAIKLVLHDDTLYLYDDVNQVYTSDVKQVLSYLLETCFNIPQDYIRSKVIVQLISSIDQCLCHDDSVLYKVNDLGENDIVVNNGVLDLITKDLVSFDEADVFFTNKLPIDYEHDVKRHNQLPDFMTVRSLINDIIGSNEDKHALFIQMMRAILFNKEHDKLFVLNGDIQYSSPILVVLRGLIGDKNISDTPLSKFTNNKYVSDTSHKRLLLGENDNADINIRVINRLNQLTIPSLQLVTGELTYSRRVSKEDREKVICLTVSEPKTTIPDMLIDRFLLSKEYLEYALYQLCSEEFELFRDDFVVIDDSPKSSSEVFLKEFLLASNIPTTSGECVPKEANIGVQALYRIYKQWLQTQADTLVPDSDNMFHKIVVSKLEELGYARITDVDKNGKVYGVRMKLIKGRSSIDYVGLAEQFGMTGDDLDEFAEWINDTKRNKQTILFCPDKII